MGAEGAQHHREGLLHLRLVILTVLLSHTRVADYTGARNKDALKKLGVTHVLSAVGFQPAYPDEFKYKVLNIDDSDSEVRIGDQSHLTSIKDIITHMPDSVKFIRDGINAGGVVVHCAAGISRSSSMCIAYENADCAA